MTNNIDGKKKVPKWIRILFFISFPGTFLFIYRMIYEMTYITWLYGPQTIGFSLVHSNILLFLFYIISLISFIWWILFFFIWHLANIKAISKKSIVQFVFSLLILILFSLPYEFYQRITIQLLGLNSNHIEALHYSAANGDKKTTKFLIEKGININSQDKDGRTALMSACVGNKIEIVEWLLKNGSEINIKDSDSTSALDDAVNVGNIDIVRLLIENGADMSSLKRTLQNDSLILNSNYRSEEQMSNDFYLKRDSLIHVLLKEYKDK